MQSRACGSGYCEWKRANRKCKAPILHRAIFTKNGWSLGAEDEGAFEMRLLHFRRTFVEKMFAIHAKVEMFKKAGKSIGGYARHYYDLFCFAQRTEILEMLRSDEYKAIKTDDD